MRPKRPQRLPVVLTRDEVCVVIERLEGVPRLMALLMYGAGLRLLECARLRVKDVDFTANQLVVRGGKGNKDRVTMLPAVVKADLPRHLVQVREQHTLDLQHGAGWVELPYALARQYPNAGREWGWQWVFPATRIYTERATGQHRRHHLHESVLQRAVRDAVRRAGIAKHASCPRETEGHGERLRPATSQYTATTRPSIQLRRSAHRGVDRATQFRRSKS